jgi:hypothetical protein
MTRLLTLLGRPSRRASRALPLLLSAILALTASCGADYKPLTDGPGAPALIPGSFVLVAIDGRIPPYNPPNSNVTFIAGDCVTTSETFTLNLTTATGSEDPVTAKATGFVLDRNAGSVIFQFSASSTQAAVLITGNGFAITYLGLTLLFERVG